MNHKVTITDERGGEHEVYVTVGFYPTKKWEAWTSEYKGRPVTFDPRKFRLKPGELFVRMGKVGSSMHGMLDVVGIQTSLMLQSGIKLQDVCTKMRGTHFEPSGRTDNPEIETCTSIVDYVFHWLEHEFLDRKDE